MVGGVKETSCSLPICTISCLLLSCAEQVRSIIQQGLQSSLSRGWEDTDSTNWVCELLIGHTGSVLTVLGGVLGNEFPLGEGTAIGCSSDKSVLNLLQWL